VDRVSVATKGGFVDVRQLEAATFAVQADATGRLALIGELDLATVGDFETSITEVDLDGHDLMLDLSELSFIDAYGLAAFIRLHHRLQAHHASLILTNPSPLVRRVFAITRLDQVVTLAE
jgi:anti-sigma B factor antagonist